MPVLDRERKTKRVVLPSSTPEDEAWVEIYEDVLTGDMLALTDIQNQNEAGIVAMTKIIKDWNFTERDGKTKAPINAENVKKLSLSDLVHITDNIKAFDKFRKLTEIKKKS